MWVYFRLRPRLTSEKKCDRPSFRVYVHCLFANRNGAKISLYNTVEPRFNEPLYNEVLGLTNDILQPVKSYSKMYGTGPRYNEPRYNEILVITNTIQKPKWKMYLDITKKCQHATKYECETDQQEENLLIL